jgi:hypothetical protein
MFAMGQFDKLNPNKGDANVTSVEHSRAARELASKSIILLQNEPALGSVPLPALPIAAYMAAAAQQSSVFRIGVLGRHAHTLPISGGGGSGVTGGPYTISLFSALALRLSINLLPPDCEAQQSTWQQGIEFFDTQPPFDLVKVKGLSFSFNISFEINLYSCHMCGCRYDGMRRAVRQHDQLQLFQLLRLDVDVQDVDDQ